MASLTTCDPSDIQTTIDSLVAANVRVSFIGLSAEIQVCKRISKATKGSYYVILDEHHFKELLSEHLQPPPASVSTTSSLVRMGFPCPSSVDPLLRTAPSHCVCHLGQNGSTDNDSINNSGHSNPTEVSKIGYFCPQCFAKYCDLPVECRNCNLTLVSAAHLARSYHHLFPVEEFIEEASIVGKSGQCHSCNLTESGNLFRCKNCGNNFCHECDLFIHETLHVCPGCASNWIIEFVLTSVKRNVTKNNL